MRFILFLLANIVVTQGVMLSMEPASPHKRGKSGARVELVPVQMSCRYCEASGISHMFSSSEEERQHIWEDHGIIAGERVFQEYHLPRTENHSLYEDESEGGDDDQDQDDSDSQDDNDQEESSPQPVRKGKRSYDEMSSSSSHDEE